MSFKSIRDAGDLNGKRVFVRVDWNVPIENGEVMDDLRIKKSLPTLELLKSMGAEVIIATHLDPDEALVDPLQKYVPEGVKLLPNLRNNPGEKTNSEDFSRELASMADIYVNEAFSASHREHASIVGVPKLLSSFAGLEFVEEVQNLSKAFNPEHPFLLIMGGAKIETKLPVIEKFLSKVDSLFVCGTLAPQAFKMPIAKDPKIIFPYGDIAALDINTETVEMLKKKIKEAKFVLWNGPLGKYEAGYKEGTLSVVRALADADAEVIVGGGDTLAAIQELNVLDRFAFVSIAGGAMLDFLATETLPGIEALSKE